jgi:hypothetical protein
VANYFSATKLVAQTTLRAAPGEHELDQLLAELLRAGGYRPQ